MRWEFCTEVASFMMLGCESRGGRAELRQSLDMTTLEESNG